MLAITAVFSDNVQVKHSKYALKYSTDKLQVIQNLVKVYGNRILKLKFNLVDTETSRKYENIDMHNFFVLLKTYKDILGFLTYNNSVIFVPMSYMTWKLADYITGVEDFGETSIEPVLYKSYKTITMLEPSCTSIADVFRYNCDNEFTYVYSLNYNLCKIDANGLFWHVRGDMYWDLSLIYNLIYSINNPKCKQVFISDCDYRTYRFELNDDVNRLMTKAKVLGDKLCW